LLAPGIWGMMGGNGNMDWNLDNKDKNDTWDPNFGLPGYNNADFNMDGLIDTMDKNNIWKPVAGKGTKVP
jgi:hypothetical protein